MTPAAAAQRARLVMRELAAGDVAASFEPRTSRDLFDVLERLVTRYRSAGLVFSVADAMNAYHPAYRRAKRGAESSFATVAGSAAACVPCAETIERTGAAMAEHVSSIAHIARVLR